MGTGPAPPLDTLAFMGRRRRDARRGRTRCPVVCDLIFSGIFERFTKLKLLLVESNIGWIPTLLEQVDDMYLRYRWFTSGVEQMPTMPSRIVLPELLGDVHDRHRRHRAAAPHEPRPPPVVDRLPAHRQRLAEQPGDRSSATSAACRRTRSRRCCTTTARPCTSSTTSPTRWTDGPLRKGSVALVTGRGARSGCCRGAAARRPRARAWCSATCWTTRVAPSPRRSATHAAYVPPRRDERRRLGPRGRARPSTGSAGCTCS